MIRVLDDVLEEPEAYRSLALSQDFGDVEIGGQTFKGIAEAKPIRRDEPPFFLHMDSAATFFRKSPLGQIEPNYIHSDDGLGRETGILFLNPDPPVQDGTSFWMSPQGKVRGPWDDDVRATIGPWGGWQTWRQVPAKFNRLVLFPSDLYHSRTLYGNYGEGDSARLIQVMFLQ